MSSPRQPQRWNRSWEREIRELEFQLRITDQRAEQLWRMHERGTLGRRAPSRERVGALSIEFASRGFHVCVLCDRDFWTIGDRELVLNGDPARVVCWICGDEHDPALTAQVLADAAAAVEGRVAVGVPKYTEHWVGLLRELGAVQRALDLEDALRRQQEQVRRLKAAGLSDPDSWVRTRGSGPA